MIFYTPAAAPLPSGSKAIGGGVDPTWLLLAGDNAALLVDVGGATSPALNNGVAGLFAAVQSDGAIGAVLELLTASGLSDVPPFVLARWGADESLHLLVRGTRDVVVQSSTGNESVDGAAVSTWVERVIPTAGNLTVGAAPAGGGATFAALPLGSGVVWASSIAMGAPSTPDPVFVSAAPVTAPAPTPVPVSAPVPTPAPAPDRAVPVAAPEAEADSLRSPWRARRAEPAAAPPETVTAPPAGTLLPVPVAAAEHTITELDETELQEFEPEQFEPVVARPTTAEPEVEADGYDHLFEETVVRSIEDAAVRPADEEHADSVAAPSTAAGASSGSAPVATIDGDHDGETIMSGDLAGMRARVRGGEDAPRVPVARELYLVLSTGAREPFTETVIVGRSPSVSKVSSGRVPRLVTIPGDQDISRSHAQFTLEGDTVVVTDLHSRNGTSVILPGKAPQLLRQGEPTAVLVNTVVDLGGGITVTVTDEA